MVTGLSDRWRKWHTVLDFRMCGECFSRNGKIYDVEELVWEGPPVHEDCRCYVAALRTIPAGTATDDGTGGADYYLVYFKQLPPGYLDKRTAKRLGWESWKGNLRDVLPDASIGRDVYQNDDGRLPVESWRVCDVGLLQMWVSLASPFTFAVARDEA